jgi:putative transposase
MQRQSWDTAVKHLARSGIIYDILSAEQIKTIPRSNLSQWKNESEDKYQFCDINQILHQEIELIKKINQSSKIKNLNKAYFSLADTFHQLIGSIKGVKTIMNQHKETIVDSVEKVKNVASINDALQIFNLSRGSYENYKSIVIHKREQSYFKWCTKRFVNQLLPSEVNTIKKYMSHTEYK